MLLSPYIYSLTQLFNKCSLSTCRSGTLRCKNGQNPLLSSTQSWMTNRDDSVGIVKRVTQMWRSREDGPCHCWSSQGVSSLGTRQEQNGSWKYARALVHITARGHRRTTPLIPGPDTSSLTPASTTTSHAQTEPRLADWPMLSQNPASWLFQLVFFKLRAMTH